MELTQAQISEIVLEETNREEGVRELITTHLNSLLKHERTLWQEKQPDEQKESSNGFRTRCVRYHGMEFALQVPRIRQGRVVTVALTHFYGHNHENLPDLYSGVGGKDLGYAAIRGTHKSTIPYHVPRSRYATALGQWRA